MKTFGLVMMMGASLSLAACGQDADVGEGEAQTGENAVAGQPGELGTAKGSFDVAGERPVESNYDATTQNSGEAQ